METIAQIRDRYQEGELTAEAVDQEIAARYRVLPTLVGWLYPGIVQAEISELEALKLSFNMDVWDQTIGCNACGRADWQENATDDPTLWHAPECPCYGRRDVAGYWFNLDYVEKTVLGGKRCGLFGL